MIETAFGDQRGKLRPETARAGRLMHDQAATGAFDRGFDRFDVERDQRAQVEDVGFDTLLAAHRLDHMNHRAIGEDGQPVAFGNLPRLAQRDLVIAFGHHAGVELLPRLHRLVVIARERAVVDALGLEEDDRVVVLDARDQQPLGVIGRGRDHRLEARDMGEDRLGALAMRLPAENAPAKGRADGHRCDIFARRTIA